MNPSNSQPLPHSTRNKAKSFVEKGTNQKGNMMGGEKDATAISEISSSAAWLDALPNPT